MQRHNHSNCLMEPQTGAVAPATPSRAIVWTLGAMSSIALLAYGLVYMLAMPGVTVQTLVSGSFGSLSIGRAAIVVQTCAAALYAFSSLPLCVLFSVRQYRFSPAGIVLGACASCLGLTMQILNMVPGMARYVYPGKPIAPPAEMAAWVSQSEWIHFVSLDVAAFTLIYVAGLIYAAIYWRSRRILAYTLVASPIVFLLHLPVLWVAPRAAVMLMGLSVCIMAIAPLIYAPMALESQAAHRA